MTKLLEAARRAYPEVALSEEALRAYLGAGSVLINENNAADLYLACACAQRMPSALAAFERAFISRIPGFLGRLKPTPSFTDEVSQMMRERLFVGPSPKIVEYSGKGTLAAWLRVVTVRAAIDLKRSRGEVANQELDSAHALAGSVPSPELQALRNRYRPLFKEAFNIALGTLTSEQRNLLRLHFVDGLTMEEVGRVFKVNRSTIFRRLGGCTSELLERMRAHLGTRLGVSPAEFDSLAEAVKSDLELSLGDLFKSTG